MLPQGTPTKEVSYHDFQCNLNGTTTDHLNKQRENTT